MYMICTFYLSFFLLTIYICILFLPAFYEVGILFKKTLVDWYFPSSPKEFFLLFFAYIYNDVYNSSAIFVFDKNGLDPRRVHWKSSSRMGRKKQKARVLGYYIYIGVSPYEFRLYLFILSIVYTVIYYRKYVMESLFSVREVFDETAFTRRFLNKNIRY
jgi:hypothetical protein